MPLTDATMADWVAMVIGDAQTGFVEVRCPDQRRGERSHGSQFFDLTQQFAPLGVIIGDAVRAYDGEAHSLPCLGMALRSRESGTARDLAWLAVLWADIDFKDTPEAEAKALINTYPRRPHCIVRSGGGFHCYWRCELLDMSDDAVARMARGKLRQLARDLHGDMAAADVARIMRVPGTLNKKTDPAIPSRITLWNQLAPYSADEFPGEVEPGRTIIDVDFGDDSPVDLAGLHLNRGIGHLITTGPPVGSDGSADAQSVICALARKGLTDGQILRVFRDNPGGIGRGLVERGPRSEAWMRGNLSNARNLVTVPESVAPIASDWQEPESFADMMKCEIPMPRMLIEGMLPEGHIHALVADAGVGKSWVSECIALHLAAGRPLWGRAVLPMRVLVVQEEMSKSLTAKRSAKLARGMGLSGAPALAHTYRAGVTLDNLAALARYIRHGRYEFVVLDSFAAVKGKCRENDNDEVTASLNRVKTIICDALNVQVLLIHHTKKPNKDNIGDRYRGASAFKGVVDNLWEMHRNAGEDWFTLEFAKTRDIERPKDITLQIVNTDNGGVAVIPANVAATGPAQPTVSERMRAFVPQYLAEQTDSAYVPDALAAAAAHFGVPHLVAQSVFNQLSAEDKCPWAVEGDYLRPAGSRVMGVTG